MSRRIGRVEFMQVVMKVSRWSPEDKADLMKLLQEEVPTERKRTEKKAKCDPRADPGV